MADDHPATDRTVHEKAARLRRLAEVFGDDLPEQTADDLDEPAARRTESADEWLRSQVPPHHG